MLEAITLTVYPENVRHAPGHRRAHDLRGDGYQEAHLAHHIEKLVAPSIRRGVTVTTATPMIPDDSRSSTKIIDTMAGAARESPIEARNHMCRQGRLFPIDIENQTEDQTVIEDDGKATHLKGERIADMIDLLKE